MVGNGIVVALPPTTKPPSGAFLVTEDVRDDRSIVIKFPWFRAPGGSGHLKVSGRRVGDESGSVHGKYSRENRHWTFQPGALLFSGEGCWEVTGRAGDMQLTFVVSVLNCLRPRSVCPR